MKKIVEQLGKHDSDLDELRFLIKCLFEFTVIFRFEELLSVKLKDIQIKDIHTKITVAKP